MVILKILWGFLFDFLFDVRYLKIQVNTKKRGRGEEIKKKRGQNGHFEYFVRIFVIFHSLSRTRFKIPTNSDFKN